MVIRLRYSFIVFTLAVLIIASLLFLPSKVLQAGAPISTEKETIALPVIMYHHLLKNTAKLNDYTISPKQFEQDLSFIAQKGYTTITVQQLVDFLQNGTPLPARPIMITFDDGYESVYEYAYPLLQKHKMNAVVLILGKYTDLYSAGEPQNVNYSHMSWEQLKEMQDSGWIEVGNHTYGFHSAKGKGKRYGMQRNRGESVESYQKDIRQDLCKLNQEIQEALGVNPAAFAYPFGAISKEAKEVLKHVGFQVLFTCEEKVNHLVPHTELPTSIRRVNRASRYSTADFFAKMGIK